MPAALLALVLILGGCREAPRAGSRQTDQDALERGRRMLVEAARCASIGRDASCREACDLGHSNSCARLGRILRAARLGAEADAMFRRACDGGSGLGCAAAGRHREARFYARVHCEQGDAESCAVLADDFASGLGGPPDHGAAAMFRQRACALGLGGPCRRNEIP